MVVREASLPAKAVRKIRRVAGWPLSFTVLVGAAWVLLWFARLAVLTVPLRRLVKVFGEDQSTSPAIPLITTRQSEQSQAIGRAIAIAARYSPSFANCYPQALVARLFLRIRRIPHALFFGVRKNHETGGMDAHAWVAAGPLAVTGGHSFDSYTVVRSFLSEPG